jgi:quercetin dioxygenase-like cupin family protein
MRRTVLIAVLLVTAAMTTVGVALATAPSGVSATTLGRMSLGAYHLRSPSFKIFSKRATDTVVLQQTIQPGGSTGWHSHPGPAFIVVTQGEVTLYDGDNPSCAPHTYEPGTGFLDRGFGHVHIARNEGSTPAVLIATYLAVPPGGSPRIDAPAPDNCPF